MSAPRNLNQGRGSVANPGRHRCGGPGEAGSGIFQDHKASTGGDELQEYAGAFVEQGRLRELISLAGVRVRNALRVSNSADRFGTSRAEAGARKCAAGRTSNSRANKARRAQACKGMKLIILQNINLRP